MTSSARHSSYAGALLHVVVLYSTLTKPDVIFRDPKLVAGYVVWEPGSQTVYKAVL